ncbi:hypothetical protein [Cellulomonas septica]|uniref:DUF7878 domain-containing protein n=1 Tax=Cellulomonas septica TaxID=285080 RepID=A0ABX1JZX5_9CELL|nr:hypothetical protein [Cellulomonas septica]NKY39881.1 hypothetical protein [Cellulomonas septica]
MRLEYRDLSFDDLQGDLVADYLVAVDAHLFVTDGDRVVYDEPYFPVVELARALAAWAEDPARDDFRFVTLSSDVIGLVTIEREGTAWSVYSVNDPSRRSSPAADDEVVMWVREFVDRVRGDLYARGVDADHVLGLEPRGDDRP